VTGRGGERNPARSVGSGFFAVRSWFFAVRWVASQSVETFAVRWSLRKPLGRLRCRWVTSGGFAVRSAASCARAPHTKFSTESVRSERAPSASQRTASVPSGQRQYFQRRVDEHFIASEFIPLEPIPESVAREADAGAGVARG